MDIKKVNLLSAICLVGGTCVGGGMLALPVATGAMGFVPAIIMMGICWFAMTCTGLLLLEASLWMKEGEHIISMASRFLGPVGKVISALLYLFMCYASLVAYTAGSGSQMAEAVSFLTGVPIAKEMGAFFFVAIFGMIFYFSHLVIGRINAILVVAMIVAYCGLIGTGISEVNPSLLAHSNWNYSLYAIPLLLTSFSFQTLIPSLPATLKGRHHVKYLRFAVIGGTTMALLIYVVWEFLILGMVPVSGPEGLMAALAKGEPATRFLRSVGNVWIPYISEFFAFFALVTSFFGIGLGLFDFIADGFKIKLSKLKNKIMIWFLIMLPVLFFAMTFERAFLVALDISGGYGDSILNGIIPILMVWVGRYHLGLESAFRIPGGRGLLLLLLMFYLFAVLFESFIHLGIFPSHPGVMTELLNI